MVARPTPRTVTRRHAMGTALFGAGAIVASPTIAHAKGPTGEAKSLLALINEDRGAKGLVSLSPDAAVTAVAQDAAAYMARQGHDGKTVWPEGFWDDPRTPSGFSAIRAVAAASSYPNAGSIRIMWREYASYDDVLMASNFDTVGVGMATAKSGTTYVVALVLDYHDGPATPAPVFKDVSRGMMFREEIERLAHREIVTGWPDGTYRPLSDVNRDAMIVFLYRAMGNPRFVAPKRSPFTDVSTRNMYYKQISWAYAEGISTGWRMKNGTRQFRPLQPVKRDAMAAFLMRASGEGDARAKTSFKDVRPGQEHAGAITWMKESGISLGWDDGTYRPLSNTKRDAMAAFLIRWMNHTGY